jgi:hypothetical protein
MLKILHFSLLAFLTLAIAVQGVLGQSHDTLSARIKAEISRRGTGEMVIVKLKTGEKLEGRITQILDESFDVTDTTTNRLTTVLYTEVSEAKGPGRSHGSNIALGVGIAVAVAIVVTSAKRKPSRICPLGCVR